VPAFRYGAKSAFRRYTRANLYRLDSEPTSWRKKRLSRKSKRSQHNCRSRHAMTDRFAREQSPSRPAFHRPRAPSERWPATLSSITQYSSPWPPVALVLPPCQKIPGLTPTQAANGETPGRHTTPNAQCQAYVRSTRAKTGMRVANQSISTTRATSVPKLKFATVSELQLHATSYLVSMAVYLLRPPHSARRQDTSHRRRQLHCSRAVSEGLCRRTACRSHRLRR
jgi:hypothetical protein